ncbi:MAG: hypothetical protein U0998_10885 [Moraxellaceae bacterium]|nr:hypothetical protein [Moraxellaceae bacterium]
MRSSWKVLTLLSILLAGCGGGGGGQSTDSTANPTSSPNPTVTLDESSRTINAECPITQTLMPSGTRGDGMRIDDISWLQTVQLDPDHPDTRMVAGKAIKLRVDLLADTNPLSPLQRVARIYDPVSKSCKDLALSGPSRVPASTNVESLTTAYSVTIPAELVKPNMSVSVLFNDNTGRSVAEANQIYRVLRPVIRPAITETIRVIPIQLLTQLGSFSSSQDLSDLITRLYPVTNVNVVVQQPFVLSSGLISSLIGLLGGTYQGTIGQMQTLLSQLDDHCQSLNGNANNSRTAPKCVALLPSNLIFRPSGSTTSQIVGLAYVGGITMLTRSISSIDTGVTSPYLSGHWIGFDAMTFAHEYGHLLNLDHANCGSPSMLDPRLYSDGRLGGGAGWDAVKDVYFSSQRQLNGQPQFADVMSYCGKEWMSDRGYLASLGYRSGSAYASGRLDAAQAQDQWLKISLTPDGWQARKVGFAPATLRATELTLDVESDMGLSQIALRSAVVSEHEVTDNFGPFYVNIGQRKPHQLRVRSKGMELARLPLNRN